MDDLDRLPNLSPMDEREIPPMPRRAKRPKQMTLSIAMILAGTVLILVCGFLLFAVYGPASKAVGDDPESSARVLGWMFGIDQGGWVAIPASFGILLGVAFVALGLVKAGKRRREPDV